MSEKPPAEVIPLPVPGSTAARHEALRRLGEEWWEPPADLIDTLPKGGVQLRYLSHIWVRKAFQDADPDWYWEPMSYDDTGQPVIERDSQGQPVGFWIWLHLLGTKMPGYGSVEPGKRDAIKELIGDALRNAGMRLVGGSLWVKQKPDKKAPAKAKEQKEDEAPHYEKQAGKDRYDRLCEKYGDEPVKGALATFGVSTFSELTDVKEKAIEASLLSRARLVAEQEKRDGA
jgi:hypothetical protein